METIKLEVEGKMLKVTHTDGKTELLPISREVANALEAFGL